VFPVRYENDPSRVLNKRPDDGYCDSYTRFAVSRKDRFRYTSWLSVSVVFPTTSFPKKLLSSFLSMAAFQRYTSVLFLYSKVTNNPNIEQIAGLADSFCGLMVSVSSYGSRGLGFDSRR
jgi:hypothetical protein